MQKIRQLLDDRGVSPVIAIALLIAITVALAAGAALTFMSLSDEALTGPSSQMAMDVTEEQTHVELTAEATRDRADQLTIKVNGEETRVWEDYSAGQTKNLYCLEEGDEVTVVGESTGPDGERQSSQVVAEHTMQTTTVCQFKVSFGGEEHVVSPVNWDSSSGDAKSFYSHGYQDGTGHAHAHMPPEYTESDTSYMFFYVYEDQVSLILVHDQPDTHGDHNETDAIDGTYEQSDIGGGAVDMWFEGLPESGEWVVEDDPNDFTNDDRCNLSGWDVEPPSKELACFAWATQHTDGGVYRGGFTDTSDLNMTIHTKWDDNAGRDGWGYESESESDHELDEWKVVMQTEDGLETRDLNMNSEVVITGANEEAINGDDSE